MSSSPSVDGPAIGSPRASASRSASAALWSVAGVLLGLGVVGTWYTSPRALMVQEVRFEGHQRADAASLRHLIDLPNGATHLDVREEAVARGAMRHPWVRDAWVRRTWHGVVVVVDEHRPVALAQIDEGLYYLNDYGEPFLAARSDDLNYPVIAGLDHGVRTLHPELAAVVLRDAVALLRAADLRGLVPPDHVSEVVFTKTRGFTIHLRGGTQLLFGLEHHDVELDRLSSLIASGVDLNTPTHIDLAPERVAIVRPLESRGKG